MGVGFFVFLCLYVIVRETRNTLVQFPKNTAVLRNNSDSVRFECKSDRGRINLKWFVQSNGLNERQELFNGYSMPRNASNYCQVDNPEDGKYDLKLTPIEDAGQTYICFEPGSSEEVSAELIVLEPEVCYLMRSERYMIATCTVIFRGNWVPVLKWSLHGTPISDGIKTSAVSNQMVSSTLVVPLNLVNDYYGYTCATTFDIADKPRKTTNNDVPDYKSPAKCKVFETSTQTTIEFTTYPGEVCLCDQGCCNQNNGFKVAFIILMILLVVAITIFVTVVYCKRRMNKRISRRGLG